MKLSIIIILIQVLQYALMKKKNKSKNEVKEQFRLSKFIEANNIKFHHKISNHMSSIINHYLILIARNLPLPHKPLQI